MRKTVDLLNGGSLHGFGAKSTLTKEGLWRFVVDRSEGRELRQQLI